MAKVRAQTLQQRFGFDDDQLATPGHDALMCELDQRLNELLRVLGIRRALRQQAHFWKDIPEKHKEVMRELPVMPLPVVHDKTWEAPVMSDKYMVGFIDMRVTATLPLIQVHPWPDGEWVWSESDTTLNLEVKTCIPSVGELLRQLRMYQTYRNSQEEFVVVSPDSRWAATLAGQRIASIDTNEWKWLYA